MDTTHENILKTLVTDVNEFLPAGKKIRLEIKDSSVKVYSTHVTFQCSWVKSHEVGQVEDAYYNILKTVFLNGLTTPKDD